MPMKGFVPSMARVSSDQLWWNSSKHKDSARLEKLPCPDVQTRRWWTLELSGAASGASFHWGLDWDVATLNGAIGDFSVRYARKAQGSPRGIHQGYFLPW